MNPTSDQPEKENSAPTCAENSAPPRKVEALACDNCGRFGAFEFDGRQLCEDCYGTAGACCQ